MKVNISKLVEHEIEGDARLFIVGNNCGIKEYCPICTCDFRASIPFWLLLRIGNEFEGFICWRCATAWAEDMLHIVDKLNKEFGGLSMTEEERDDWLDKKTQIIGNHSVATN